MNMEAMDMIANLTIDQSRNQNGGVDE